MHMYIVWCKYYHELAVYMWFRESWIVTLEILRYGKGMERVSFHTHYVPPTYPKGISSDLGMSTLQPGMNQVRNGVSYLFRIFDDNRHIRTY